MLFDSVYSRRIDIFNPEPPLPPTTIHTVLCVKAAIQYVTTQIQRMSISVKIVKCEAELKNYVKRFV